MSKCKRSKRALDVLNDISLSIASLRDLVEEGAGEDEEPKSDSLYVCARDRARRCATKIRDFGSPEHYIREALKDELKTVERIIDQAPNLKYAYTAVGARIKSLS